MDVLKRIWCAALALLLLAGGLFAQTDASADTVPVDYFEAAKDPETTEDHLALYVLPLNAAQLAELAEVWQGHLQEVIRDGVDANLALENASPADADRIRADLVDITLQQIDTNAKYSLVLEMWASRGGTDEELSQHQAFDVSLTAETLLQSEPETIIQLIWAWLTSSSGLISFLWTALTALVAIAGVVAAATFARWLIRRALQRAPALSQSQRKLFESVAFWLAVVLGVLVVLGFLGFSATGVFALVGGLSLILGLALQETIGNLASGLMLIFLKPIDVGDYVVAAGSSGTVEDVGLVSTRIRAFDNTLIVIPNGRLWSDTIQNVDANKVRRVEIQFTTANRNNFAAIKTALVDLAAEHPACLSKPQPSVYVSSLDENLMTVVFWVWVKTADHWSTYVELSERIHERFNAETMLEAVHKADITLRQTDGP